MSISSGLLGLWQEVARSDSWATESRSARCAEDWTAEAGEGQLARLGAGCSGGRVGCRKAQRSTYESPYREAVHTGRNAATQQRSAGRARRRGERWATWSWRTLRRRGDDEARLLADAVLRGASVGRVEAQLQGRSQMEMSWQSQTISGWIHRRT